MLETRIAEASIEPAHELAGFLDRLGEEGAVVSFVGRARPRTAGGGSVERLFLDHHPRLTASSLADIGAAALARFEVTAARIVHRCGAVETGAAIVFVATAAPHRRAAFEAADYLMDRLKVDAVFWKREEGDAGAAWIEPTETDRADRARWSD